ncbi:hypothetical protein FACS189450_14270 [Spirochaetia bacterium]|nr:hypothetical protein FACS189450_11660 [Spirochaetia bacterium]GHU73872.1 hypothetical protein FACS189450_14270 [Spirochaetia bacterium]
MDNDEVLLLGSGFCGLSGKKQAIILGMAKALVFTQAERGQTAKAPLNALTGARRRSVGGKTTHTRQRVPAL